MSKLEDCSDSRISVAVDLYSGHAAPGIEAAWRVQLRAKHPVGESPTETKDSSFVAWEASWRESKATEPSDIRLEGAMQNTRLQHNVNVDVASLLSKIRWLSCSCLSESNKSRIETSPKRRLSPAGYQRRHGVKDGVSTGEALDVRQGNLVEEMTAITVSGKCRRRHQGGGSGRNTVDGRALKRVRREGPGPVSVPYVKARQG